MSCPQFLSALNEPFQYGWDRLQNDLEMQVNIATATEMSMDVSVIVSGNDFRKLTSFLCSICTVFPECGA